MGNGQGCTLGTKGNLPRPQTYTLPSAPSATVWLSPHATCTIPAIHRLFSKVGLSRLPSSPVPAHMSRIFSCSSKGYEST